MSVRILHVIPGLARQQGGPALNVLGIARAIRTAGGDNTVFAADLREPASSRRHTRIDLGDLPEEAHGLSVELFRARPPYRWVYAPDLAQAIERQVDRFDLVHIHSLFLYPQFAAQRVARQRQIPYVVSIHGCLDPALRRRSRLAKAATDLLWQRGMLNEAACLHFTTASERDLASDLGYRAPTAVIPNGIDWAAFQEREDHPNAFENGPRVVLFLGRISHKKGLDLLIHSFADVKRHVEGARLEIAGPDDEGLTPSLKALTSKLGIDRNVTFSGLLSPRERLAAFRRASVWALPSKTENFATAIVEAMAAGVPVVISPQVNLAPEIDRERAGIVCERDRASLATALTTLLTNSDVRNRLARTGRNFARRYDWSELAPSFLSFYNGAIEGARR